MLVKIVFALSLFGALVLVNLRRADAETVFDTTPFWNGTSSVGDMNGGPGGGRAAGQTFFAGSDNVLNSFSFFLDGVGGSATGYVMEWNAVGYHQLRLLCSVF